jgi:tRNA nucleotidyltransferase/poly(A) polymerase
MSPKESPEIKHILTESIGSSSPLIGRVRAALPGQEIYLVGGAVRAALLGRITHDLDFAVPSGAISLARRVASLLRADYYVLDEALDIARLIITNESGMRDLLDFAAFRGTNIDSDLRGRDFTINAIAYHLDRQTLFDPLLGVSDLQARLIRGCSKTSLTDDPIRILRAVRLAAVHDFDIEAQTRKSMMEAVHLLPLVTPERLRDELFKILEAPHPDSSLRSLETLGVFPPVLPELSLMQRVEQSAPHTADVWEHTLNVIHHLEKIISCLIPELPGETPSDLFMGMLDEWLGKYRQQFRAHFEKHLNADRSLRSLLFFAALYHDVSKPETQSRDQAGRIHFFGHDQLGAKVTAQRAAALNLSHNEIRYLETVIKIHMRFHFFSDRFEGEKADPSRKSIYHFFRDAGEAGVDLTLLGLADVLGMRGSSLTESTWAAALDIARLLLENYWEKPEETTAPPRLIDGNDIMSEYNLLPGPIIGQLLAAIREAQAIGKVSTREEALVFGSRWLKEDH